MARLRTTFKDEIVPKLKDDIGGGNAMAVPKIEKVVISMGIGKLKDDKKVVETAMRDLTTIAGQKAVFTRAKKSVSNFRLREGNVVGCMVTLRGDRMFEFLDRLISVVIPRIRDFRGLKTGSFDHAGNYSMGLADQMVFPEIKADKTEHYQGMNITITIKNSSPDASLQMLRLLGMPFRN
jgi:large subunit ribosomal protein L5